MSAIFPFTLLCKNRQILTYFPLSSGSDAEVSHLSTTALLCTPFLRRHAFPDTKTVTNVTHCSPSGRRQSRSAGFTYLSCTTPPFCTSYKSKNNLLNQTIRTHTKIIRYVVHIDMKKVVHIGITVYSFGVLTACCATKRERLAVAR